MFNKKIITLIFALALIGLIAFFISLNVNNSPPSPIYPILQKIQSSLNQGKNAHLSDMGDFDKICVFLQDDSDEGFAKEYLDYFLSKEKIDLDKRNFEDENPTNILLFIKGNKAIGVEDWTFSGTNIKKGYLVFDDYQEKRNLCLPWSKAVISNNLYLSKLE